MLYNIYIYICPLLDPENHLNFNPLVIGFRLQEKFRRNPFFNGKNPWISCRFSLKPVPGIGVSPPRRLLICATTGRGLCEGIGRLAARSNQEWRTCCQRKMVIFHGISWDIVAIYSWITQNQIYMDDFPQRVWYDPFFFRKSRIFTGFLIYPLLGKFPMLGGWPSARFRLWNPGINGAINHH